MYWLVLLDDYSAGFGLMVVVITTCLVVTRVYGKGNWPPWTLLSRASGETSRGSCKSLWRNKEVRAVGGETRPFSGRLNWSGRCSFQLVQMNPMAEG